MTEDFKLYLLIGFITFLSLWRRMATQSANYHGTAYGRLGWMPVTTFGRKPTVLDYIVAALWGHAVVIGWPLVWVYLIWRWKNDLNN